MPMTTQLTTEHRLTRVQSSAGPGRQQRPLGKAYRFILTYQPKKKATAQSEVSEAVSKPDTTQSSMD